MIPVTASLLDDQDFVPFIALGFVSRNTVGVVEGVGSIPATELDVVTFFPKILRGVLDAFNDFAIEEEIHVLSTSFAGIEVHDHSLHTIEEARSSVVLQAHDSFTDVEDFLVAHGVANLGVDLYSGLVVSTNDLVGLKIILYCDSSQKLHTVV